MKLPFEIVLDASVILKTLQEEDDSEKVKRILNLKNRYKLLVLVPELFKYEFIYACARKMGHEAAAKRYDHVMLKQIVSFPLDRELIGITLQIMNKYPHVTFYDASYHALAKVNQTVFITADQKYYHHVKQEKDIHLLSELSLSLN
jgi:predicted nucleic acid-binding protein